MGGINKKMTDRDYLVNILKCFYFLKRKSKDLSQEILRLDLKIENERIEIAAHKCDTAIAGDGCSVHCSKPLSVSYLIDKQMEVNEELKRINEKIKKVDEIEKITERLEVLTTESQIIINNIFQRQMTLNDVAKIEEVSKQTIKNRLDKALEEMMQP